VLLSIPRQERNALYLGLMYMPLSDMRIPIPGISYLWWPSQGFRINIGLPFQVMYKPDDDLTFDLSYMLLRNIHTQVSFRVNEQWSVYTSYMWANQSWYLHERDDDKDRLNSYAQSLAIGIQTKFVACLGLDLSASYVFNRFYFTGRDYSDRNHDRIDIANGLTLSIKTGLKW
jgi:hypothetical protein